MRQCVIATAILLAALMAVNWPALAGMAEDCVQERNANLGVSGCTEMIRSGQFQDELAIIYFNRGNAYASLGKQAWIGTLNHGHYYRLAIQDYDDALRLDPSYVSALFNRGYAYSELGDYRRAIQDYDQVLRLDPSYVSALFNRGYAYSELGDYRRAIQDYDQVLQLEPSATDAKNNREAALENLNRVGESQENHGQLGSSSIPEVCDLQRRFHFGRRLSQASLGAMNSLSRS